MSHSGEGERKTITVKQILVRAPNWLGDVVMSLAFFKKTAATFPMANIEVVVKEAFAPLLEGLPSVTAVHRFKQHQLSTLSGLIRFCNGLKADHRTYDLYVSLPDSFSSALMGRLLGCKVRIGYRADLRSLLLTRAIKKPQRLHRVEEYCWLIKEFNAVSCDALDLRLPVEKGRPDYFTKIGTKNHAHVVLHMNSEAASRRIPLNKAVSLARGILERHQVCLYLTGTAQDNDYNRSLKAQLGSPETVNNLSGRTNVMELARLFTAVDLVISADTGPAHLANSIGAPLVVLWGPGDETNTSPYRKKRLHLIKSDPLPCQPCLSNRCALQTQQCLADIHIDKVLRVVARLLTNETPSAGSARP
jgi:heptosyltransferase II